MKRFSTLRARFALWVAGLLLVALLAFGALVYASLSSSLKAGIDDSLQLSAAQASAAVNIEDGEIAIADGLPETSALSGLRERGFTIRVLSSAGQLLQAVGPDHDLPVSITDIDLAVQRQPTFATVTAPASGATIRVYTTPIVENDQIIGVVQVARTLEDVQDTLQRLLVALLISIPVLVCGAAIGGYVLAARALTPIDTITRTARRISAQDLHARLNLPPTDDEVGRLAATFDTMLDRLDTSFQRERQFTADASHELRTPLAAMQTILGVIREQRRTPEDYEHALDDLAEETNRLRALADDLLRLARGETYQTVVRETVDLTMLLQDVTDSLAPLAEAKGLSISYDTSRQLLVCGDSDGLIRLFVNLLDNAIKYTECGGITVRTLIGSDSTDVIIADTGIGIATDQLPRIFDRFYRVETSRTTHGAGLGLAIAQDIAHAHGGTITLHSAIGTGTTFTVRLPQP
ncbi:MAG: ATP-binding protein [Roseiflexaceae bacterium]